jgi:alpha-N-arabinofuranosidase
MNRRTSLKAIVALLVAIGLERKVTSIKAASAAEPARFGNVVPFTTKITIDTSHPGALANPFLCGTNTQWVDGGDGLLLNTGTKFATTVLNKVKQLAPTIIRYPGGSYSDVYNWRSGVGAETARKGNAHFSGRDLQVVRFGTAEFLALCEATGAKPLITVNVCTGTAQDAADWVLATNVTGMISPLTGNRLPKVTYWEIGNEPYLKEDDRSETWMEPDEYARRANAFISAMRKVDPTIIVGIPLRSDTFNGIPVTPYQGFNQKVLPQIKEPFDYVSLHNAYLPFLYSDVPSDNEIYAGLMGASETVRLDLEATRAQLSNLLGKKIPMAITEHTAMVTFGKSQDSYLSSPAGALYVADLLRLFATQPDILMANHWSLIGNWFFGALSNDGVPRPVFNVLRMYRDALRGNYLPFSSVTKSFSAPQMGMMRGTSNIPVVTGMATLEAGKLRVLILNKDPKASTQTTIELGLRKFGTTVATKTFTVTAPFAAPDTANTYTNITGNRTGGSSSMTVTLPACSLTYLETQLV